MVIRSNTVVCFLFCFSLVRELDTSSEECQVNCDTVLLSKAEGFVYDLCLFDDHMKTGQKIKVIHCNFYIRWFTISSTISRAYPTGTLSGVRPYVPQYSIFRYHISSETTCLIFPWWSSCARSNLVPVHQQIWLPLASLHFSCKPISSITSGDIS